VFIGGTLSGNDSDFWLSIINSARRPQKDNGTQRNEEHSGCWQGLTAYCSDEIRLRFHLRGPVRSVR